MAEKTFHEFHFAAVQTANECSTAPPYAPDDVLAAVRVARALMDWMYGNLNAEQQVSVADILNRTTAVGP